MERAFHLAQTGRPGPGAGRRADGRLLAEPAESTRSSKVPAEIARPTIDAATAERIVAALPTAERPVLYAGGGVLSARASAELAALAEALELPVAHTLMGKGCVPRGSSAAPRHDRLLGHADRQREVPRRADLILAVGTRLAEANSSSWDPRFTFSIPPTRLIHIDADAAEIGRNFPTELGVVADAKLALAALAEAAQGVKHRNRGSLRAEIARGRAAPSPANWARSVRAPTSTRCARSAS